MPKNSLYKKEPVNEKNAKFPKAISEYEERTIGWNFSKMDGMGQWPCTFKLLTRHRGRLLKYEGKTMVEIGNIDHCHEMPIDAIVQSGQKRLKKINFSGSLYQLDIGTPARLWGILRHNIFYLLWIDLKHKVYPMKR